MQAKLWRHTLRDYAYPIIGDLSIADVDTELNMQVLEPIWKNKPETASRVCSRMDAVLDWAVGTEMEKTPRAGVGTWAISSPPSGVTRRCPMSRSLHSLRPCAQRHSCTRPRVRDLDSCQKR